MYLSSTDIRRLLKLKKLVITGTQERPFDATHQIGPCSVDVRISNEFWKFRDNQVIDVLNAYDIARINKEPEALCEKIILEPEESIDIPPRQVTLTHVLEYIEMPKFLAGIVTGRSRFSRLGLSVHCTGSFINPGYKGYMPLQLVNNTPNTIKIYPFLGLAQLVFVLTSSDPDVDYQELSRTMFKRDTGGPSLWFLDENIQDLALKLAPKKIPEPAISSIYKELEKSRQKTLNQLSDYLQNIKLPEPHSQQKKNNYIEEKMQKFVSADDRREKKMRIVFFINTIVLGACLSVFIPSAVSVIQNNNAQDPVFWSSLLLLIFSSILMWLTFDFRFV